jgi:hypothetical protein
MSNKEICMPGKVPEENIVAALCTNEKCLRGEEQQLPICEKADCPQKDGGKHSHCKECGELCVFGEQLAPDNL